MIFSQILSKILSFGEAIHQKLHPKATYWSAFLSGFSFLILISSLLCSCSSHKTLQTQVVETILHDTIYLSNVQYDSIYISHDRIEKDTLILSPYKGEQEGVLIKETNVEYRYKLLRDTIRISKRDSIPYEVRIIETREVPRKLTWYDHTARATFWLLIGVILLWLYRRLHKR